MNLALFNWHKNTSLTHCLVIWIYFFSQYIFPPYSSINHCSGWTHSPHFFRFLRKCMPYKATTTILCLKGMGFENIQIESPKLWPKSFERPRKWKWNGWTHETRTHAWKLMLKFAFILIFPAQCVLFLWLSGVCDFR